MSAERLFHLMSAEDAPRARADFARGAVFEPGSLEREGFVHLSFAEQLSGTLAAHFPLEGAAPNLWLIELVGARLSGDLRLERSRDGQLFPHLYRALHPDDLVRVWRLSAADGAWALPHIAAEGGSSAADQPRGAPPAHLGSDAVEPT